MARRKEREQSMDRERKMERLAAVARLYYQEDRTQNEIAGMFGISRPMVSKLLKEAKQLGVVTIRIAVPGEGPEEETEALLARFRVKYGLAGGALVKSGDGDVAANQAVAQAGIAFLEGLAGNGHRRFGIGWGHIVGELVSQIEKRSQPVQLGESVCPLIGNGGAGLKNYHSNELVRVIGEHSQAEPEFLYTPAYMTSEQDLMRTMDLENYQEILASWRRLEVALVNIGNFPSVPDFASKARYGEMLVQERAAARILNYFVGEDGHVLRSDTDYAVQIPLDLLKRVPHVVGICSANTNPRALDAALRTVYIRHLIAPERVAAQLL